MFELLSFGQQQIDSAGLFLNRSGWAGLVFFAHVVQGLFVHGLHRGGLLFHRAHKEREHLHPAIARRFPACLEQFDGVVLRGGGFCEFGRLRADHADRLARAFGDHTHGFARRFGHDRFLGTRVLLFFGAALAHFLNQIGVLFDDVLGQGSGDVHFSFLFFLDSFGFRVVSRHADAFGAQTGDIAFVVGMSDDYRSRVYDSRIVSVVKGELDHRYAAGYADLGTKDLEAAGAAPLLIFQNPLLPIGNVERQNAGVLRDKFRFRLSGQSQIDYGVVPIDVEERAALLLFVEARRPFQERFRRYPETFWFG